VVADDWQTQEQRDRSEIVALANAYAEALDTKDFDKLRDV
jgi:hypothetical protein